MATGFVCPQCKSDNTQKIANVIEQGTTIIEEKSTSSGVAVGSSGYASVTGTTNTSGIVRTQLAQKLADESEEYSKQVGGSPVMGIYVLLLFIGVPIFTYIGFKAADFFHSTFAGWGTGIALFIAVAGLIGHLDEIGWFAPDEKTKEGWEKLKRWEDSGHYCHGCGQRFIPGSDERHYSVE